MATGRAWNYLHPMDARLDAPQVFRPRKVLAPLMGVATLVWLAVLAYLFQFEGVPIRIFLAAGFFVALFGLSVAYYGRSAIFVDARGVTFRGIVRTRRFAFDEIRKLDVIPGPITVYAVRVREHFVHFTSIFQRHRALMQLLVDRAGLGQV